jgi:hypothetical protein
MLRDDAILNKVSRKTLLFAKREPFIVSVDFDLYPPMANVLTLFLVHGVQGNI